MSSSLDILILLILILLNGVFAMSEISLVTSRRARLARMAEEKATGAARAQELNADPTRALSTIQVGITSIGILSGIVGESALAQPMAALLISFGMSPESAKAIGVVIVVVLITYFSIVLGELVPKRIGQMSPERIACRIAPPIHFLSVIAAPFVKLLSFSTKWLLERFGVKDTGTSQVTEEEIHAMIEEGKESGVIETAERDMVRNVFRLDDRQVASLMTPRADISWIDIDDPVEENVEKIRSSRRSRLPVCEGGLENVKGVCSTRTLLQQILENGKPDFKSNLSPVNYVPESLTGMELLEHFRKTDVPLALVVDEYGEVMGLVTPRDVLEAIAGEFKPELPGDGWASRREDGSWLLDGIIPVPELKDVLNLKRVPEEEQGRYSTLAGMMMLLLGRLPREGDTAEWGGWKLEIVDMDGRRVDKVIAFPAGGRPRQGAPRPGVPAGTPEVVPSAVPEAPQKEEKKA
ncbi:hemolysin family protein [uncultured Sutterella sp.]|uniref:hemolysin family protein n=1 Tax=uncultured Sutterella sp. TaxID=286133 RepID=UPI002637C9A6|nr:hemolysin family protein [uncultured Sutterella sp.]